MNLFVLILVGLAGVALGAWLGTRKRKQKGAGVPPQTEEKEENIERVAVEARRQGRITNDEVEELLGVSDATATNYLQELEERGALRQVGDEGRHVYYEPL